MAITKLNKHDSHQTRIRLTEGFGPHYAALICVDCNKQIQWLSQSQYLALKDLGLAVQDQELSN